MQLHLLALRSELVDGVLLVLDGTDLEAPPPQCQHQHLPYLAEHKTLVSRRMPSLCLSLLVDLAMCPAKTQALQPQKLCLTHI